MAPREELGERLARLEERVNQWQWWLRILAASVVGVAIALLTKG